MTSDIEIYDTTLRDGTQGHGISFSVADKLRIAERLDTFGVHYIEGGWPGSNPRDIEFFAEAKHRTFRHARLAAFGSTRRKDVTAAADDQVQLLIAAGTPVVTIFGKTSPLHVREVLQRPTASSSSTTPSTASTASRRTRRTRWRRCTPPRRPAPTSSPCATPTAARCRATSPRSPGWRASDYRPGSASTPMTTSASAWPTRWRRSNSARRTCREPSTATASALATATSPR